MLLKNKLPFWIALNSYVEAIVSGVPPLSLPKAKAKPIKNLIAFGGTEQRNLPEGYTELEYIESNGTQYIDTGVSGNATIKITAQASEIKGSSQALLSSTSLASGGTWFGEFTTNQKWGIGSGGGLSTIDPTTKMTAEITFDGSGCSGTVNGESITRSATITQGGWTIMATSQLNYPFSGKVWGCQITQGGVLVRNFVPCKNSSNVVGMYDTVSGTFFENGGTGDFVAGNAVSPTPTTPMDIICNNGVLKVSPNLANFVSGNIVLGYAIDNSTGQQQSTPSSINFYCQQYIPVQGGESYVFCGRNTNNTLTKWNRIHWYDSSKNFISTCSYKVSTATIATAPANAAYARISCNPLDNGVTLTQEMVDAFNWVFQKGTAEPAYMPYGEIYTDGTVETINIHTKNLFDVNNVEIQESTAISANGSLITHVSVDTCITYIPVKPNTTYTISGDILGTSSVFFRLAQYKADKTFISRSDDSTGERSSYTFTTGVDTYYIRFHYIKSANLNTYQLEQGSTATAYVPYFDGGTATCEDLLSVGTYTDEQEVIAGGVTRKVGVKVLDGTENWAVAHAATYTYTINVSGAAGQSSWSVLGGLCSHLAWYVSNTTPSYVNVNPNTLWFNASADLRVKTNSTFATLADWTQYLAAQYAAGTPVIVVYPLATETTETVTGQPMSTTQGDNIAEITQASMDGLELSVKYIKGA